MPGLVHGYRFPADVVVWAVRWSLEFPVSYRDLARMMEDRGVDVDPATLFRWAQRFSPEIEKRLRRQLRSSRGPWHVDETYVRVAGDWHTLDRAVDGTGRTIDVFLSPAQLSRRPRRKTPDEGSEPAAGAQKRLIG